MRSALPSDRARSPVTSHRPNTASIVLFANRGRDSPNQSRSVMETRVTSFSSQSSLGPVRQMWFTATPVLSDNPHARWGASSTELTRRAANLQLVLTTRVKLDGFRN